MNRYMNEQINTGHRCPHWIRLTANLLIMTHWIRLTGRVILWFMLVPFVAGNRDNVDYNTPGDDDSVLKSILTMGINLIGLVLFGTIAQHIKHEITKKTKNWHEHWELYICAILGICLFITGIIELFELQDEKIDNGFLAFYHATIFVRDWSIYLSFITLKQFEILFKKVSKWFKNITINLLWIVKQTMFTDDKGNILIVIIILQIIVVRCCSPKIAHGMLFCVSVISGILFCVTCFVSEGIGSVIVYVCGYLGIIFFTPDLKKFLPKKCIKYAKLWEWINLQTVIVLFYVYMATFTNIIVITNWKEDIKIFGWVGVLNAFLVNEDTSASVANEQKKQTEEIVVRNRKKMYN